MNSSTLIEPHRNLNGVASPVWRPTFLFTVQVVSRSNALRWNAYTSDRLSLNG